MIKACLNIFWLLDHKLINRSENKAQLMEGIKLNIMVPKRSKTSSTMIINRIVIIPSTSSNF